MPHVNGAITEFGRRIGLPALRLAGDRPVQLSLEGMGVLFLERLDDDLLLYLARPFPPHEQRVFRRALALCRHEHTRPFLVRPALYAESMLLFLMRVPGRELTAALLEKAIPLLSRLQDEALTV